METKITIYKIKDYYKIIETPLHKDKDLTNFSRDVNSHKLFNNIFRAKTNISNLIQCNDFTFFLTSTINSNFNKFDLNSLRKSFNLIIRKERKKTGFPLKYIIIPEKHKSGAWHFHGVLDSSFSNYIYVNCNGYKSITLFDKLGFNSVTKIRNLDKVSSYITKYISKDFEHRSKGSHLYFASQGLNKPIKVFDKNFGTILNNYKFQAFQFENEYCKIGKLDKNKYYNLITLLTLRE